MATREKNGFYQRYFAGFVEEKQARPDGRDRIERTYVGEYYRAGVSAAGRAAQKAAYGAGYVCAATLLLFAASRRVPANAAWYMAVTTGATLLLLLWMAIPAGAYLFTGARMTRYQYRSTSRMLLRLARPAALGCGLGALLMAAAAILGPQEVLAGQLLCAAEYAVAALPLGMIYLWEKGTPYEQRQNPLGGQEDADPS